ncbi:MAG: four helix bundle protein [Patescibacteria group bacterium]
MKNYDLEERTMKFSKNIIILCKNIPFNMINKRLVDQLLRSATSIGANYREANECDTKKDFKNKMRISKKEARETIYWLELLIDANLNLKDELLPLLDESKQLMKILASIYLKTSE